MPKTATPTKGQADQEALALLHASASPDLYRRNGFRVLELPVDATSKDVNRRKMMVEMAAANGVPLPPGAGRCFPLDPVPDEFTVRDAVQRLGDPERRLVDEFFWFWPHDRGESKADQALCHLTQGEHDRAAEIWSQQEANRSVSHVSTHNLAVMHHLLALDWEDYARSSEVDKDERKNIEQLWSRAFRRWQKLLDEEGFWSRLTARVREFEDPRLTAGTVRRLRAALPAALLSINARLALQAVERGKKDMAARLVEVIRKSGFPEEAINDGLSQAVEPARVRVKALCKAAQHAAESDPIRADNATRQLLEGAMPLLDGLDCLLPAGHPTRDMAHDDVTEQVLHCQVAFAKKINDWNTSVELLSRAVAVPASESVKKKLCENLETVKKNADTSDDFCGTGYYDLPHAHLAQMEQARRAAEQNEQDQAIVILESLPRNDLMACPHCHTDLQWTSKTASQPASCPKCSQIFQTPGSPEGLSNEHLALVRKALAYCLGCRAIRRLNESAPSGNEVPPTIQRVVDRVKSGSFDAISAMCAQTGQIPPGVTCHCMACGSGIYSRYMTFNFREAPLLVCGACADRIRGEEDSRKSRIRTVVQKSAEDFVRAGQLDPANKFVQNQLKQMRELCSTFGVSMPTASKAKSGRPTAPPAISRPSRTVDGVSAGRVCPAANWSIGLAIAGLWPCGLLAAIPAVICGHKALKQIKDSGGGLRGQGRAKTGLVLGYLAIAVFIILIIAAASK